MVNVVLPTSASFGESIKYEIGQRILTYQQDQKLSYEQIAELIGLSLSQTMEILRGNTAIFSLESLVNCVSALPLPLKFSFISSQQTQTRVSTSL